MNAKRKRNERKEYFVVLSVFSVVLCGQYFLIKLVEICAVISGNLWIISDVEIFIYIHPNN
jgi:hypothetical protein